MAERIWPPGSLTIGKKIGTNWSLRPEPDFVQKSGESGPGTFCLHAGNGGNIDILNIMLKHCLKCLK